MGKLLDSIASQLRIRSINEESNINIAKEGFVYKDVPETTRLQFKRAFNKHMYRKLKKMKVGESIDYMFDCGNVRPLSMIMDDANQNLAEVLQSLPELPEGERYSFSPNSYICITLAAHKAPEGQKRMKVSLALGSFAKS